MFAVETGTSMRLAVLQRGRFVDADPQRSRLATHRDLHVSFLSGVKTEWLRVGLDVKGGVTLIPTNPRRDGDISAHEDPRGDLAATGGLDLAVRVSEGVSVVPTIRYSRVFGGVPYMFDLSPHVLRYGVAVRLRP